MYSINVISVQTTVSVRYRAGVCNSGGGGGGGLLGGFPLSVLVHVHVQCTCTVYVIILYM